MRPKAQARRLQGARGGQGGARGRREDAVQAELERLREGFASLDPVERPAAKGDLVVIDYSGTVDGEPFEGSEATRPDGRARSGEPAARVRRALAGASAGDEVTVEVQLPRRPPAREPGGQAGELRGHGQGGPGEGAARARRRVRRRGLGVRHARRASRGDPHAGSPPRSRAGSRRSSARPPSTRRPTRREIDLPKELVHARAHEMWERLERSLASRGASAETYLQMQGKTREEAGHRPGARRRAGAAARGDPGGGRRGRGDRGLRRGDARGAASRGRTRRRPEQLLERLRANGRDALLREDLRLRKAADVIAELGEADPAGAGRGAREALDAREGEGGGRRSRPLDPPGRRSLIDRGAAFIDCSRR